MWLLLATSQGIIDFCSIHLDTSSDFLLPTMFNVFICFSFSIKRIPKASSSSTSTSTSSSSSSSPPSSSHCYSNCYVFLFNPMTPYTSTPRLPPMKTENRGAAVVQSVVVSSRSATNVATEAIDHVAPKVAIGQAMFPRFFPSQPGEWNWWNFVLSYSPLVFFWKTRVKKRWVILVPIGICFNV